MVQKHININQPLWEKIKIRLDENGQKLSPLCNVLLRDYFKILRDNKLETPTIQ